MVLFDFPVEISDFRNRRKTEIKKLSSVFKYIYGKISDYKNCKARKFKRKKFVKKK